MINKTIYVRTDEEAIKADVDFAKVYDKVREEAVKEYCNLGKKGAKRLKQKFKYVPENLSITALATEVGLDEIRVWFEERNTKFIDREIIVISLDKNTMEITHPDRWEVVEAENWKYVITAIIYSIGLLILGGLSGYFGTTVLEAIVDSLNIADTVTRLIVGLLIAIIPAISVLSWIIYKLITRNHDSKS